MEMKRRGFFAGLTAMGAGATVFFRNANAEGRELPSSPGAKEESDEGVIELPGFKKDKSYSLDQALLNRRSDRSFKEGATVSKERLSRILWAADGVNRKNDHRTAPSALARYPVDIYAALPEGVYRYEPEKHRLQQVVSRDIRDEIPRQPGFKRASVNLLYVINKGLIERGETAWADIEVGCMVQNVYLECAALGLGSCVYALVRYDNVTKILGLKSNQILRIAQAAGELRD
ncbi:MAG: SagB/ThcOx family dehydrogenase [bacterium]